jgi:WD40 repeat protein
VVIAADPAPNRAAEPGTWQEVRSVSSGLGNVRALALAPDGEWIAVCATINERGRRHLLMVCSVTRDEAILNVGEHDREIHATAISPDGSMIATTGDGEVVTLWDVAQRNERQTLPLGCRGLAVAFTPDGERLIAAGEALSVWSVPDLRRVVRVGHVIANSVAVSPDSTLIATGEFQPSTQSHVVRLRSPGSGEILQTFVEQHTSAILSLAFSTDGLRLVSGSGDETTRIWDVDSRKLSASYSPNIGPIFTVAFSPDSSLIAFGNWNQPLQLWSTETGRHKLTLPGGTGLCAAFSSDGRTLVTTGSRHPEPNRLLPAEVKVWRFVE